MDEIELIRVEPAFNEIKRYEVWQDGKPKGYVFQWMTCLNLAHENGRLRKDGKTRPFWSIQGADGRPQYRVKLETRKAAIDWLL